MNTQAGGKQHLGIHTELFSDGVIDLYEAGVINNEALISFLFTWAMLPILAYFIVPLCSLKYS